MSKVYSWQIQKNPAVYAYIVNPLEIENSNPTAYIGNELKGNLLEKIKEWVRVCSDELYITQFNKMVELCKKKGYTVAFENPETYLNVTADCDNLRGPAGRGIKNIELTSSTNEKNEYTIIYDDNTTSTFYVLNGQDGRPGADGDAGVSSKLIVIYRSGRNEDGTTFKPDRPSGGSYDFVSNKINILVSTTVIEVGINVFDANIYYLNTFYI